ncbi:MAG TPA: YeaH/YhbH family protein [Cytophagales bacterium]|nr:YeaH/YhbH family protein [Cytophagales bacterium]
MSNIIDRRLNSRGKSISNRQRFLKRVEDQIKKALPDVVSQESLKDSGTGGTVKVPIKGLDEPSFGHDPQTGTKQIVRPGNDRFSEGDRIPKPKDGEGDSGSGKGSNSPEVTEDNFVVILSRDEFLQFFFDDLELPNLVKKFMQETNSFENRRAGYTKNSIPSRLNVKTTYQQSLARQISLQGVYKKKLEKLNEQLTATIDPIEIELLKKEIERVKRQLATIPFFDNVDLRYNHFEMVPIPATSAVMFCIMDVSGSMGYHEKDISKRFFTLLYLFLTKQYENVELVFIRHHTEAKEVNEEEFFNSKESGGTMVAPSLSLMHKIIKERYSNNQWNIYGCQASDGDVWADSDAQESAQILKEDILPLVQYMAYIEINKSVHSSSLWNVYNSLADDIQFSVQKIYEVNEIWPVFRGLFKKSKVLEG